MPLDPLSTLSVAASVVQFIEFAGKIVSKGRELYKSSSGALGENERTETVTKRLHDLTAKLKSSLQNASRTRQNPARTTVLQPAEDVQEYVKQKEDEKEQELRLQEICNECAAVSAELLKHMTDLKVPKGQEHRQWKSFRQALKSVWSKKGVDDIARRLLVLRHELDTHVLVLVRRVLFPFN